MEKEGWRVDKTPKRLATETRRAFVDIRATRHTNGTHQQILLAEVKCFADENTWTTDLYTAIGQYLVYRAMMDGLGLSVSLYLAVPESIYDKVFDATVQRVIQATAIKFIIVDLVQEVITSWT